MTNKLLLEPTATAQWKRLLNRAKHRCQHSLHEDVESYLIFTLMRFTRSPHLANTILGPELLNCQQLQGHLKEHRLRDLGDQCLLLSGLFPQRAEKRLVKVSYYVDLGITAYQHLSDQLSKSFADLYRLLSQNFIQMMDVLLSLCDHHALHPLQAFELWQQTGSRSALNVINDTTKSTPIIFDQTIRH